MSVSLPKFQRSTWTVLLALVIGGTLAATSNLWLPGVRSLTNSAATPSGAASGTDAHDDHSGHDHSGHDHAGHSEANSIHLSQGGLKNIGYRPLKLELGEYTRYVTMPAMVVERPGRSQIHITAPLTGVVTKIYPIEGAAIAPESPMFEIRLTHEELVAAQRDLIRTAENLDVIQREIARLKSFTDGVIAGKRVLEQQYEQQKLEATLRAERQALLLHGLNDEQVDSIVNDRKLFQKMTVRAPDHTHESSACADDHMFHVQSLPVKLGQQVDAGQELCVLADHCELFVEGRAFADDAPLLLQAAREKWPVSASLITGDSETGTVQGLTVLYLADTIDPQSRALRFFLSLPNQVVLAQSGPGGHDFIEWRYKPGQRMELRVPAQRWDKQLVVPVDAIVDEGAETYLYQQNGDHFDRVPVHVKFRDQRYAVVENDVPCSLATSSPPEVLTRCIWHSKTSLAAASIRTPVTTTNRCQGQSAAMALMPRQSLVNPAGCSLCVRTQAARHR